MKLIESVCSMKDVMRIAFDIRSRYLGTYLPGASLYIGGAAGLGHEKFKCCPPVIFGQA